MSAEYSQPAAPPAGEACFLFHKERKAAHLERDVVTQFDQPAAQIRQGVWRRICGKGEVVKLLQRRPQLGMHDGETRFRFPHEFKGRLALTGREILRKRHGEPACFQSGLETGSPFLSRLRFP